MWPDSEVMQQSIIICYTDLREKEHKHKRRKKYMFRKQMFLLVIALALFVAMPACALTWNLAANAINGIGTSERRAVQH